MRLVIKHRVEPQLAAEIHRLLQSSEAVPTEKETAVLRTFTVPFGSGIEADIKVCNGDTGPWIDAVLFDGGHEVALLEPGFGFLLGEYEFSYQGHTYVAELCE